MPRASCFRLRQRRPSLETRNPRLKTRLLTPISRALDYSPWEDCLGLLLFFRFFFEHYHHERNHQGLENKLIEPGDEVGRPAGEVKCRERLGGMLNYYYREAA